MAAAAYREQGRRKLVTLDDVRVASPCNVSWDDMDGNGRARHCRSCDKDVFNISAMKRSEAEEFLEQRLGTVCIRFYRRRDGTVMTEDCPVGFRARLAWRLARPLAVLAAVFAYVGWHSLAVTLTEAAVCPTATQGFSH